MEKKKLNKLKINKTDGFPVISVQEQMQIKGGYTVAEMETMVNNGTWSGGAVDGMGYVGGVINIYGGNILDYADYYWSGTENELIYFGETLYNGGVSVYNGFVWTYNRTLGQY